MILAIVYLIIAPLILGPLCVWLVFAQRDILLSTIWRSLELVPMAVGLSGVAGSVMAVQSMVTLYNVPAMIGVSVALTLGLMPLLFRWRDTALTRETGSSTRHAQARRDTWIAGLVLLGVCGWLAVLFLPDWGGLGF